MVDLQVPPAKIDILQKATSEVELVEEQHRMGLLTNEERYQRVVDIWTRAKDEVTSAMIGNFDKFNPVYMIAISGARGNVSQLSQLAGMRLVRTPPVGPSRYPSPPITGRDCR